MSTFEAIVLGLVQGLSEFLPISSSGHLALLEHFFNIYEDKVLLFAVLLHGGTLLSILVAFYKEIGGLIKEFFMIFVDIFSGKGFKADKNETRKLGFLIITAAIPAAAAGILFKDMFADLYNNILVIGVGLLITGTLLFVTERYTSGRGSIKGMKYRSSFFVGIMQALALFPGISRSGSTIVGSLITGLERKTAVRFAFLTSIPTVLGAFLLEVPAALKEGFDSELAMQIGIGILLAAVSGFIAIKTMIRVVSNSKLFYFSIYTWIVGVGAIIYSQFFMNV
jgi:undecaprenyl-diphosphatase